MSFRNIRIKELGGTNPDPVVRPARSRAVSGKCLDVSSAGTADGTKIQLWTCNGTGAQTVDGHAGLHASGRSASAWTCPAAAPPTAPGFSCGPATVPAPRTGSAQADGTVRNPQSGKCLDAAGGSTADGTALHIWDCNGAANQKWTLP